MEPWVATGAKRSMFDEREKANWRDKMKAGATSIRRDLVKTPDWFERVTPETVRADAIAGLTGATLSLPQSVAFAAIAGLPPQYGFYTALVPPVVTALFGSSWHAAAGPATAISALVFGALAGIYSPGSPEFISAAIALALLAGIFQLLMGLMRLGSVVDFVSHSVMIGFVAGAAVLIALSQLSDVLMVPLPRPEDPGAYVMALWHGLPQANLRAVSIAILALSVGYTIRRFLPRWPNYLLALLAATGLSLAYGGADAGLHTVGAIDTVIPSLALPHFEEGQFRAVFSGALAIGVVGLLEAMSVARALAAKSGQMLDGNREFVGQGLSNVVGSFFQCYPSSSSFTRSGVNYDAGARTPLSMIFCATFLLLILLLVAPYFAEVPIAGMAGVIMLVAWRLINFHEILHLVRTSTAETLIAVTTFLTTVLVALEFSIYVGVMMSLVLFLRRIASPIIAVSAPDPSTPGRTIKGARLNHLDECPQLMIAMLEGPFYFGTVEAIRREFMRFERERPSQKHILFSIAGSGEVDLPAAEFLIEEDRRREARGGSLHVKLMTLTSFEKLARFQVFKALGREKIHLSKRDALEQIVPQLDQSICATCTRRIFRECPVADRLDAERTPSNIPRKDAPQTG